MSHNFCADRLKFFESVQVIVAQCGRHRSFTCYSIPSFHLLTTFPPPATNLTPNIPIFLGRLPSVSQTHQSKSCICAIVAGVLITQTQRSTLTPSTCLDRGTTLRTVNFCLQSSPLRHLSCLSGTKWQGSWAMASLLRALGKLPVLPIEA